MTSVQCPIVRMLLVGSITTWHSIIVNARVFSRSLITPWVAEEVLPYPYNHDVLSVS